MNPENEYNSDFNNDNSFNNQGIENLNGDVESLPNVNSTTSELTKFGKGLASGVKTGMNAKNNPALGLKKPKEKSDLGKKDNNQNANKDKNNPATGQKSGDKNKKGDGKPKTPNLNNKKPGNNKGLDKAAKAIPHPAVRAAALAGSKLGIGKKKKDDNNAEGPNLNQTVKSFNILGMKLTPIQIRIAVSASIIFILVFAFLIFLAILNGTTAAVTAAMCGETDYDIGNADITAFMCSMQDPVDGNYKVTSLYGWRNFNTSRMHHGIDLGGATGTTIVAVHEGEVIQTLTGQPNCDDCGYGNYVTIKHSDNSYTRYAHLNTVAVSKGTKVAKGQKIGEMGNTGSSSGPHLHFEIRTGLGYTDTVSPNAFFGYSDQGYEDCLDPNNGHDSRCGIDKSGDARKIGDKAFEQICGRTRNYSNGGNNSGCCETDFDKEGNLVNFVGTFEGSGGYCDNAKTMYEAYKNDGDRVTIGYGVTSDYLPDLTHAGQCMSVEKVDAAKLMAIDSKRNYIQQVFKDVDLLPHEEDAMVSMAYNGCAGFFNDIAKAAKDDDYEGIWKAMKGCTNGGMLGLERRRKAEFALYVTGDYTIASEYKQKNWTEEQYNDYDSDNVIARKATGTSSQCVTGGGDKSKVVEIAIRELEANQNASTSTKCSNIEKYLKSCGYNGGNGGTHHYCGGFVTYVLKEAGVDQYVGLPNNSCLIPNYENGITEGVFHKAGGSYVPEPGDIAVSNGWSHVMIVEKVEGETLHIIGGNQNPMNNNCPNNGAKTSLGNVTRSTYSLNSSALTGYITYTVPNSYSGSSKTESMNKYTKYKTLKTFKIGDLEKKATVKGKYGGNIAQSFTIANNHYIVALTNRSDSITTIQAYKTSNGKLVNSLKGYFGHGNGMTYNDKTGKIYVTNRSGHKKYWRFPAQNAISGNKLNSTNHTFERNISSIAYDKSNNKYYLGTGKVRIYDSNFKKLKEFSKVRSRTSQDVGAYNGIVLVVDDKVTAPKQSAIDLYRVSDGAYLGSYNFNMPSYELESVAWDYTNDELALLFYKSPGYNYIFTTKATILN